MITLIECLSKQASGPNLYSTLSICPGNSARQLCLQNRRSKHLHRSNLLSAGRTNAPGIFCCPMPPTKLLVDNPFRSIEERDACHSFARSRPIRCMISLAPTCSAPANPRLEQAAGICAPQTVRRSSSAASDPPTPI